MQSTRRRKVLASLFVVGALGVVASLGIFGAFSKKVENTGNTFSAGTLELDDFGAASKKIYAVSDAVPGDNNAAQDGHCVKIKYVGPSTATIVIYASTTGATGLEDDVDITVTAGTGDASNCSDFDDGESSPLSTGTLAAFTTAHSSWANGLAGGSLTTGQSTTYKIDAVLGADTDSVEAQGKNAGETTFTWRATVGS